VPAQTILKIPTAALHQSIDAILMRLAVAVKRVLRRLLLLLPALSVMWGCSTSRVPGRLRSHVRRPPAVRRMLTQKTTVAF
jgi:hypothetical protein